MGRGCRKRKEDELKGYCCVMLGKEKTLNSVMIDKGTLLLVT